MPLSIKDVKSGSGLQYLDYIDPETGHGHVGNIRVSMGMNANDLAKIYFRMKEEDLIKVVFFNNPDMSVVDFLAFFAVPDTVLFNFARKDGIYAWESFGLFWIWRQERIGNFRRAEIGFSFFGNRSVDSLTAGRAGLEMLFNRFPLDDLFGTTPVNNRLATRYAQHLGFDQSILPRFALWNGDLVDGVVSHLSRDEFLSC